MHSNTFFSCTLILSLCLLLVFGTLLIIVQVSYLLIVFIFMIAVKPTELLRNKFSPVVVPVNSFSSMKVIYRYDS